MFNFAALPNSLMSQFNRLNLFSVNNLINYSGSDFPTVASYFSLLHLLSVTHPLGCSYLPILDTSADVSRSVPRCPLV
jgi:hypothetical protein